MRDLTSGILYRKFMDAETLVKVIADWAKNERLIKRVYIFGSRARNDFKEDSDLDVAVVINKRTGDENVLTTWMCEHRGLESRLDSHIPYKLQLELLDGTNTPVVLKGVTKSHILVYEDMASNAARNDTTARNNTKKRKK